MSAANTTDQAQKPPPEPMEDPTGHGSLEQLAKKGMGGAQVLAEKLTGSNTDRYLLLAVVHAHMHTDNSCWQLVLSEATVHTPVIFACACRTSASPEQSASAPQSRWAV